MFFDLPSDKTCIHPEHDPPTGLYIPPGKGYRHVCPACKTVKDVIPPQYSLTQRAQDAKSIFRMAQAHARLAAPQAQAEARDAERLAFVLSEIRRDGMDALSAALHDRDGFPLDHQASVEAIDRAAIARAAIAAAKGE